MISLFGKLITLLIPVLIAPYQIEIQCIDLLKLSPEGILQHNEIYSEISSKEVSSRL